MERALRARPAYLRAWQLRSGAGRGGRHAVDEQRARPQPGPVFSAGELLHLRPDRHRGGGFAVRTAERGQERADRDQRGTGNGTPHRIRLRQRGPGAAARQAPDSDLQFGAGVVCGEGRAGGREQRAEASPVPRPGQDRGNLGDPPGYLPDPRRLRGLLTTPVLLDHDAKVRQRGLNVLGRTPADRVVRLDDRRPPRTVTHGVGHRQEGLRYLVGPFGQVVAEVGTTGRLEVGPERLQLVGHVRKHVRDRLLVVARRERGHRLVGDLDRGSGDATLAGELLFDHRLDISDNPRLDLGGEQHLLQRGGHENRSPQSVTRAYRGYLTEEACTISGVSRDGYTPPARLRESGPTVCQANRP